MRFTRIPLANILFIILMITSCSRENLSNKTLRVAEQYGLAYAPVQQLRLSQTLENKGIRVEWTRLMNTAAIREAMLAGRVDIGFMGIPPFLLGMEQGMEWRIFTGLCRAPLGLVTLKEGLNSLGDFSPGDRIALPQPGSIQHILLAMAAKKEFGRSDYFDSRLLTLSHPDGAAALRSGGDVTAHFTSPPYLFEELKLPGARLIVDGEEAFDGPFTFIVGVAAPDVPKKKPELLRRFKEELEASIRAINEHPAESAELLAGEYGLSSELVTEYLENPRLKFETGLQGLEHFGEFMTSIGLLSHPPASIEKLTIRLEPLR